MATINYKFADGHIETFEVSEEFAIEYDLFQAQQRQYEEREKKRRKKHLSFERMINEGFDFQDITAKNPIDILIENEQESTIQDIISMSTFLTDRQRYIMDLYYKIGFTKTQIAKLLNISQAAVSHHLSAAIRKILKKI